ncbi:Short-chain dehydrogenase [Methylobacterium sp. UNC300MFChir4.1]|uniref:SDR family NAD(P)-dependent oxidoreductase n=1 Tax=Methylobacterium sp. UNC300MFChir4.1 TaxID=1502747 RepID=UPI0008C7E77C|nr:SDR family NAD(P)-dependent oxidoreductase [Methylobacterium sp. UNC300MFChir4.1]SEP37064.1 Short-chain dehydrogenase [Methylobacterium sp. UNC300MFChir4.1]
MSTFLSIGSGPGMGLATAERFAREGFQVVLSARNEGKVRDLAEQLKAKGHKVDVRTVDAADPASVAKLVEGVERDFGGIDVLHFNAASMRNQTLADQPRDSFNTDLAVNIGGAAVAAQATAPKMLQRGSGSVLFTGGGFGLQPHPEYLSLSIGKAGIRALAQGIFEPFKEKGVHVATVTVAGFVTTAEDANAVAEHFWQLHSQPKGAWEVEAMYTPKG